jgi:CheY-like chemotaxis protein
MRRETGKGEERVNVLIVEDNPERVDWFRLQLAGHVIDHTAEVAKAIAWLEVGEYGAIFLDHDLEEHHYAFLDGRPTSFDDETGYAVARWLGANPAASPAARIVVHSMNWPAGRRMVAVLEDGDRKPDLIPFVYLRTVPEFAPMWGQK